jgi:hypothetical protein
LSVFSAFRPAPLPDFTLTALATFFRDMLKS